MVSAFYKLTPFLLTPERGADTMLWLAGSPADAIVNDDLTLAASFGYTSAAWARVVTLLNGGRFRPGRLVTHRFTLDEFERAFAELAKPSGTRGKVMLELAGG